MQLLRRLLKSLKYLKIRSKFKAQKWPFAQYRRGGHAMEQRAIKAMWRQTLARTCGVLAAARRAAGPGGYWEKALP
ncbi:hypothetical protein [Ottowia cancrivicina]|uniref:Uncharacterized protein n=1 Tax=Ottowia cancrivicina TaxID=3040346 RepID=A0AAW6RL47_9BURK|nr:hypothetical protein [Ottowia sp. 10c7w1]MDG9698622.1 hypothetical protein [Ottowia sp. 10c7w1]